MGEEEFFITLPSTASASDFPRNTTSNYRTRLAQRLELTSGEWRVTLASIDLPNKFYNITSGKITVKGKVNSEDFSKTIQMTRGWYQYPSSITSEINKQLNETNVFPDDDRTQLSSLVNVSYNSISGRADIVISLNVSVDLSYDIQCTLGLNPSYSTGSFMGERPADPSHGKSQLYVYCNTVKPWRVGDSMSPLLRSVPVHAKYGDVSHMFPRDQFVPAVTSDLDVVEIDIRWDSGESVAFEGGKVVTTLRFKRFF